MANKHSHSPWRKSILVPFWVLQILLELIMIASFTLYLIAVNNYDVVVTDVDTNGNVTESSYTPVLKSVTGVWLGLIILCFLLTITETILLCGHRLKPAFFVATNSIKTGVWLSVFVFEIIALVQNRGANGAARTTVTVIIECGLLLCFLIPLIYASIIYHRSRKEDYKPVDPRASLAGDLGGATAYPSQYTPFVVQEQDIEAGRGDMGSRRLSYNHQKDPRFESYRRASNSYGEASPLDTANESTLISSSPQIPNIHVQHHDGQQY